MTDAQDTEELAGSLLESIRLFIAAARTARPQGELSASEIAALIHIRRAVETTSGALARLAGISPQAMGATIAALEARGLIEREKDTGDARRILLRLTDAGREVMDARRDARAAAIARELGRRFDAAEIETLRAAAPLLARLAEGL
ncbi:MarR family winged helix-turn-helix transcriptional regulator [Gryllotalpicola koreensis]|uniref:Helix-turn-helix domain-containing protein n=1 Tax=Gryllotalpicola koreensis TaxID=993086 RepID=A0ABP8A3H6_9MICO